MATLKAKRLKDALKKANKVGRIEEPVRVDGVDLVLQNLSTGDLESVSRETEELNDVEYLHGLQIGMLCRSIVEIEQVDLRDVTVIEDEVPRGAFLLNTTVQTKARAEEIRKVLAEHGIELMVIPPEEDQDTKTLKLERHEWLRRQILGWSREAVAIAYRKVLETIAVGHERARDGVQFKIQIENSEEQFRRLIKEAKSLEQELPVELVNRILEESGYLPGTTQAEKEELARQSREFTAKQQRLMEEETLPEPASREEEPELAPSQQEEDPPLMQQEPEENDLKARLRARLPLSRQNLSVPAPTPERAPERRPPAPPVAAGVPTQLKRGRANEIADLESEVDPDLLVDIQRQQQEELQQPVADLAKAIPIDPRKVARAVDRPPVAGINPRYKPPTR